MSIESTIDDAVREHVGGSGVIIGWVTLAAIVTTDSDGDSASGIETIYSGGEMAWPLALGLVEAARCRLHAQFAQE